MNEPEPIPTFGRVILALGAIFAFIAAMGLAQKVLEQLGVSTL